MQTAVALVYHRRIKGHKITPSRRYVNQAIDSARRYWPESRLRLLETLEIQESLQTAVPVSYTHLDVYKRQLFEW